MIFSMLHIALISFVACAVWGLCCCFSVHLAWLILCVFERKLVICWPLLCCLFLNAYNIHVLQKSSNLAENTYLVSDRNLWG